MKNIMTRAWGIAREAAAKFGGNVREYFAEALRMAWAEIKNATKIAFDGYAKVDKSENHYDNKSDYLTFKLWEKGSKKRIYIVDYKRRTLGYVENGIVNISDKQGNSQNEIDFAVNKFMSAYAF